MNKKIYIDDFCCILLRSFLKSIMAEPPWKKKLKQTLLFDVVGQKKNGKSSQYYMDGRFRVIANRELVVESSLF